MVTSSSGDYEVVRGLDVRVGSPTFGHVLKTVPVGSKANEPHHIDFSLRADGTLWASGVLSGRTFIFDVSHPPDATLLKVDYVLDIPSLLSDGDRRIYLLKFDLGTGALEFDRSFCDEFTHPIGIEFNRDIWPHGKTGPARPHGMMFLP